MKRFVSEYEARYILWPDISYNKQSLLDLLQYIESLDTEDDKEEIEMLQSIIDSYPTRKIQGLLNNDERICRQGVIEKYARIGAIEVIMNGKFSEETFSTITHLPISDYQLLVKRSKELVREINSMVVQSDELDKNTAHA